MQKKKKKKEISVPDITPSEKHKAACTCTPGQEPRVCVPSLSCGRDCVLIEFARCDATGKVLRRNAKASAAQSVLSADDEPQGRPDEEVFMC